MIICSWHNYIVSKNSAQAKNILLELNQIHSNKSLKEEIRRKIAYTRCSLKRYGKVWNFELC